MRDVNSGSRRVFIWPMEWIAGGTVILLVVSYLVLRCRRAKIVIEKR